MPDPIIQQLPYTQTAVQNKYQENPDLLTGYDAPVIQALLNLDLQRAQKGQNPLSARQSRLGLQAAQTGEAVTKPPHKGLLGNIVSDFRQLTSTVPRLPLAMYHELQALPDIGEALNKAGQQKGLLNQLSAVGQAPGVRLIPGSFVASNLNHPGTLLEHPVFTALDLLPIAQGLGLTGKAAEVIKPKLSPLGKQLAATKAGQFVKAGFGTQARDLMQLMNKHDTALTDAASDTVHIQDLSQDPALNAVTFATREGKAIRQRYPTISEQRRIELTRMIQEDPAEMASLSGDELAFVHDTRAAIETFGNYGAVNQDMLDIIDGEIYDKDTGGKILKTRRRANVGRAYGEARAGIENPVMATPPPVIGPNPTLYHGTTADAARIIDEEGLKSNDIGMVYATTDENRAQMWARKRAEETGDQPMVVEFKASADNLTDAARDGEIAHWGDVSRDQVHSIWEADVDGPSFDDLPQPILETLNKINDVTHNENIRPKDKVKIIEGHAHALDAAGYDSSAIMDRIRDIRNTKSATKYTDEGFREYMSSIQDRIVPRTPVDLATFTEQLSKIAKTDPQSRLLLDHIQKGRWSEAKAVAGNLSRRKVYAIPDLEPVIDEIARQNARARYLKSTSNYHPKAVAKAERVAENTLRSNPPARFMPHIDKKVQAGLLEKYSTDPNFDKILPLLKEHNYGFLAKEGLITEQEARQLNLQIRKTWEDMKRDGIDPVFVHRVSENQIGSIKYPKVLERIPRPSQTTKRSWNLTPTIDDVTVAITHQGLEWLAKRGSEEFIDEMLTGWGKKEIDVLEDYMPAARVAAKSPDDVLPVANRLMKKEWTRYNPTEIITWPSARIKRWSGEEYWVPKTIAENIQRMHTPPGGRLSAVVDPIMNVFRTSLLPLAPRWHFYNILGGGIMLMAGTDPTVFRFLKEAREMVAKGEMPSDIPRGIGTVPRDTLEWNTKGSIQKPMEAIFQYKGGEQLRKFWDQAQTARDKFGNVIEKSYSWNGMVDDVYRSMAYLYGKDKALSKGMTAEAGAKAGVELARKVFQQWDRMTPIERSVMRFIFPFYGWTAHVMKFVMQYPFDHPIRTAILGSFARNEVADQGTGLPERFLNMFFMGDTDKNGNVKALNLGGMNPFRDVANNFTLAGFLGQSNPLISSAFQAMGVDTANGGPELFPNVQYDPEIGRLTYKHKNPLAILAENILPQSRILTGMADSSSEFQQLLRTNPEAAGRLITSQLGLPITFRYVNKPQEIAKAEVARDEAQSKSLNEALKTGNWEGANDFPNLRPLLSRLKELQDSGQLAQYTPQSAGQSAIGAAQAALASIFRPHPPVTQVTNDNR